MQDRTRPGKLKRTTAAVIPYCGTRDTAKPRVVLVIASLARVIPIGACRTPHSLISE